MSISNLKRLKKELLLMKKNSNKDNIVIKALDGLFLIDLSNTNEGRISPIDEAPEGVNIEVIGVNIDNIVICGGVGYEPVIIIDDIPEDDIDVDDDLLVLNIVPVTKDI